MTHRKKTFFAIAAVLVLAAGTMGVSGTMNGKASLGSALFNLAFAEGGLKVERGLSYGAHPRDRLDVYHGAGADADPKRPVVVFFYGGGWTSGDRGTYEFVAAALASRGFTTVVPDYRLFPEARFPGFVEDSARAYAWAAKRFGAGPGGRPLVVMGHSAGAHIAALLAFDASYLDRFAAGLKRPAGLVGLAGPYAFDPTTWESTKEIFAPAAGASDRARPVTFAGSGARPAAASDGVTSLLIHGLADETVKLYNTRDLGTALKAAGERVQVAEYEGIGHVGLILTFSRPMRWRAPTLDTVSQFLTSMAAPAR